MTKDEALKLALSTLKEVREETFRLMRDGQRLYAEEKVYETIYAIKEVLAQPKQEPVAWEQFYPDIGKPQIALNTEVVGYVAPQTWVGLTDEDLKLLSAEWRIVYGAWMDDFARDIEAKLKERNT